MNRYRDPYWSLTGMVWYGLYMLYRVLYRISWNWKKSLSFLMAILFDGTELDPNLTKCTGTILYHIGAVRDFLNCPGFQTIFYGRTILVLGRYGSVHSESSGSGWFRKPCFEALSVSIVSMMASFNCLNKWKKKKLNFTALNARFPTSHGHFCLRS